QYGLMQCNQSFEFLILLPLGARTIGVQLTELVSGSSEHWPKRSQPQKTDVNPSVDNSPSTYDNTVDVYICHPAAAIHNIMLPVGGALPGENVIS
ncbi:hypothetical protein STEG23_002673, partial [Scotinomys teguina]